MAVPMEDREATESSSYLPEGMASGIDIELLARLEAEGAAPAGVNWNLIPGQGGHFYVLQFLSGGEGLQKLIARRIFRVMDVLLQHTFYKEGQDYMTWRRMRMALALNAANGRLWTYCKTVELSILEWTGQPSIFDNLKTNLLPATILEKRKGLIRQTLEVIKSECRGTSWCQLACETTEAIFTRYLVYLTAAISDLPPEDHMPERDFNPTPAPPIRIPDLDVPRTPPVSFADTEAQGPEAAAEPNPYKQAQQSALPVDNEAEDEDESPLVRRRRVITEAPPAEPSPPFPEEPLSPSIEMVCPPSPPAAPAEGCPPAPELNIDETMEMVKELTADNDEAPAEASPELEVTLTRLQSVSLETLPAPPSGNSPHIPAAPSPRETPAAPVSMAPAEGESPGPVPAKSPKGKEPLVESALIPFSGSPRNHDQAPATSLQSLFDNMAKLQQAYAQSAADQKESHRGIFEYMYKMQDELQKVLQYENTLKKEAAAAMNEMRSSLETQLHGIQDLVAARLPDYFNMRLTNVSSTVETLDQNFQLTKNTILQSLRDQDARLRMIEADVKEVRTLVRLLLPDDKKGEGRSQETHSRPGDQQKGKRKFMGDAFKEEEKRRRR